MEFAFKFALFLVALASVPNFYLKYFRSLPSYALPEPYFRLENLWTEEELENLRKLLKRIGSFHTAAQDSTSQNEDLEITVKINPDGTCPHSYLVPKDDKNCVLPGRIDIFKHYALTGGKHGAKENMDRLISNVQSFQQYLFDEDLNLPELKSLFDSDQYRIVSQGVCGRDHPFYKRVQVNLILMVPGQDLPMHFDLPWFRSGANRFNLPQWLLLAMAGSKLWAHDQFPQVQGVAYIHQIDKIQGGNFFLYPEGPGSPEVSVESKVNSGLVLDGIKVIHGVQRFRPSDKAPKIGKGEHFLNYQSDFDNWKLIDPSGQTLANYNTSDLRVSLVWRSVCFKTEEEMNSWDSKKKSSLDGKEILQTLEDDLRQKGILNGPRPDPVEFAIMLIDNYVKYPFDNKALFPLNYCTLPELFKNNLGLYSNLKLVFGLICD